MKLVDAVKEFDKERKGTGTKEWAEITFNIGNGCSNRCLYCYACGNALRFKLKPSREDWGTEVLTPNASIETYPSRKGVIMFPSTHDITPTYLASYLRVALLMLQKGNSLLITTKARLDCMDAMTKAFKGYEGQILFRVTIGNMNSPVTDFWEPGAPVPMERLRALYMAQQRGFQTSVSVEPMLGGYLSTLEVVGAAAPFVTETIWVGKMNRIRLRVDASNPKVAQWVEIIEDAQRDFWIVKLYNDLKEHPQVRWKDSIREVLVNNGVVAGEVPE